jgi:hypothetical protein
MFRHRTRIRVVRRPMIEIGFPVSGENFTLTSTAWMLESLVQFKTLKDSDRE